MLYYVTCKFFPEHSNPARNVGYVRNLVTSLPADTQVTDVASMPEQDQATVAVRTSERLPVFFHKVADGLNESIVGACIVSDGQDAYRYDSKLTMTRG